MPDLEHRVTALETRVEQLTAEVRHVTDVGVTASRETLTAREAHQKSIELLNALRTTQTEHGRRLDEHSRRLDAIEQRLDAIEQRLDSIAGTLGQLALGMHTIESLLTRLLDDR